jgi:hypothetical protein
MSEQQAAEVLDQPEVEQHQDEQTIDQDVSPTAGDSGEHHEEKITFTPEQQKILNQNAFDVRGEKRKTEALQARLDKLEAAVPVEQAPVVPAMPDQYSDTFDADMATRDAALLARRDFEHNAQNQQQRQDWQLQEQQRVANEDLNKSRQVYSGRATNLGISNEQSQAAIDIVIGYGIDGQVQDYLLKQEVGPLITQYLSQNPQAMDTLRSLPPTSAAVFIETQVKPEAIKLKPKQSDAPPPAEALNGNGVPATQGGPPGTTYE